jgi:hypothetical protein
MHDIPIYTHACPDLGHPKLKIRTIIKTYSWDWILHDGFAGMRYIGKKQVGVKLSPTYLSADGRKCGIQYW